MTVSAESPAPERKPRPVLDARWRARAASVQEQALPAGRVVVSCPAPLGGGGLGRHLLEIVQALDRRELPRVVISEGSAPQEPAPGQGERMPGHGELSPSSEQPLDAHGRRRPAELAPLLAPLGRLSPAWRIWQASVGFDARAARRLPPADHLIAFNGTALAQFSAASRAGFQSLSLMSANSHFRHVLRQHARAHRQYPIERPWSGRLLSRNLREYAQAQRIYAASRYVQESFLQEGFPERAISLFPLTPSPRYTPQPRSQRADTFEIVYVGSLTVHKGVPLLLDAFRRLDHPDLRLTLVGGWKTREMRRFLEAARAGDSRIEICPGDPLPHLARASLYVHPAYEDGFAYAPAEAMACGVPVIVSEDTGMKELIGGSDDAGLVLPTGDLDALTEALHAAYRGEIFGA